MIYHPVAQKFAMPGAGRKRSSRPRARAQNRGEGEQRLSKPSVASSILAGVFLFACGGTPFALHVSKSSAELAAESQAHCRSLLSRRTVLTIASSALGATAAGAAPIEESLPSTASDARTGVVIGGVVASVATAVAVGLATAAVTEFETNCAITPRASSGAP